MARADGRAVHGPPADGEAPRHPRRDRARDGAPGFLSYRGASRLTDPGDAGLQLADVPDDLDSICAYARARTLHHNLAAASGLPGADVVRVWPPALPDLLAAEGIVLGACVLESYFLAGLLRSRGFDVRVRAGYFRGIRADAAHVVEFWRRVAAGKGREPDDELTAAQNAVDHRIEHWLCEVREAGQWRLVDANTDFLREHSGLEVGVRLPERYFEHAHDAWRALRDGAPPERYAEGETGGEAHVRRQFLADVFSLLNHDLAAVDELACDAVVVDRLAALVASDPPVEELVAFYRATPALHLPAAEQDAYSFLSSELRSTRHAAASRDK